MPCSQIVNIVLQRSSYHIQRKPIRTSRTFYIRALNGPSCKTERHVLWKEKHNVGLKAANDRNPSFHSLACNKYFFSDS